MKKLIAVFAVFCALFVGSLCEAATESSYNTFLYWARGPVRTNTVSSPAYESWAATTAWNLYHHGTVGDVGYRLLTEYVTQPPELTNQTLHLVVKVVGKNGAKVSLSQLRFWISSSDPANTMRNQYSFVGVSNLVYSPRTLGIIKGPEADEIVNSGSADRLVDQIVAVGIQSKFYPFSTQAGYTQIDQYINGFQGGFRILGICEIVSNGVVVGSANRTLQTTGTPISPILSIRTSSNEVSIGVSMESGRTAILYSRQNSVRGNWLLEATLNPGEAIRRPCTGSAFFKAVLE